MPHSEFPGSNRNSFKCSLALFIIISIYGCNRSESDSTNTQEQDIVMQIPHLEKHGTATRLVVEGEPFLMIAGELHNSTAGGSEYMKPVWKNLAKKNLNSVIATVSWELIEPEEGKFDFSLVDETIMGAREANLKLVLIWFASWKNAGSIYMPSWVKKDYEKYPRVKDENGKPLEILSPLSKASVDADARAFAMLMKHIKEIDSQDQTVMMMQIENEVGILDNLGETPGNARRDFSDIANAAYNGPVPPELMNYLAENKESLFPELFRVWEANGFKSSGTWEEVFGKSEFKPDPEDWKFYSYYTEELFMAWHYAHYIGQIASSGKEIYPIPMFANAWLKQPFTYLPGKYPSGGPLPQVIDIWRAAAPSIDFIAPDIYTDEFTWICEEFTRSGNPLFIPETRGGDIGAAQAFYAFGEFDAGCFSPFGIDNPQYAEGDPLDESYRVLEVMSPLILEHQGMGTMRGILVDELYPVQLLEMGDYKIEARLAGGENQKITGGLIVQTGEKEFVCAGRYLDIFFTPVDDSMRIGVDAVDEGTFIDGKWMAERRLNGDETHASTWSGTGLKLYGERVSVQRISIYHYK